MQSNSADLLRQLIMGFRNTQLVYVAAKLGLADRLTERPKSAAELAEEVGADPGSVYRVLRALTPLGIVAQTPDNEFSLTVCGELLRSNLPGSMRNMALLYGDDWLWRAYGGTLHSVRTGKPAFLDVHGLSFYEFLDQHPDAGAAFQAAMDDFSNVEAAAILRAYSFSDVNSIVDVGSGRGVLLSAILQMHPNVRGVGFDRPFVERQSMRRFQDAGLTDRATFVGGDFFGELPAAHNLYLLKSVLHNWDDTAAIRILEVCRQAMSLGSRLLIIERVISDDQRSGESKLFDVNMLVSGRSGTDREGVQSVIGPATLRLGTHNPHRLSNDDYRSSARLELTEAAFVVKGLVVAGRSDPMLAAEVANNAPTRRLLQGTGLFRREPVSQPDPELLDAFDSANARSEIRAQQAAIGRFVGQSMHSAEAQVDGAQRQISGFEAHAIPQDQTTTEREMRFEAVPFDELIDYVSVPAPRVQGTEAVQHGGFRLIEVWQP